MSANVDMRQTRQTRHQSASSSFSTSVSPNMIVLPFNHCHDSLQYSPSSSLSASCNDSAVIFKRLSATALSFFSRFFQPHFFIINIRAFIARGTFFRHTEQNSFVHLRFAGFFFFWQRQTGRISSYFISCFLHSRPFENAGIGTQSISCQNIRAMIFET